LAAMAAIAEEEFDHPRSTSGHAFRLVENAWEPWLPPAGHPAHLALRRVELGGRARGYAHQKERVGGWRGVPGGGGQPARGQNTEGESCTFAVWTETVDVLLPEAERVFFFRPDEGEGGEMAGFATWQRVREVVGDLLVPQDHYPMRYRAREFPPEEMLAELLS